MASYNLLFLMEYAELTDSDIINNNTTFRWKNKISAIVQNRYSELSIKLTSKS